MRIMHGVGMHSALSGFNTWWEVGGERVGGRTIKQWLHLSRRWRLRELAVSTKCKSPRPPVNVAGTLSLFTLYASFRPKLAFVALCPRLVEVEVGKQNKKILGPS